MHLVELEHARSVPPNDPRENKLQPLNGYSSILHLSTAETSYYMNKKNPIPLDSSLSLIQKKKTESDFKKIEEFDFSKFAEVRGLRWMYVQRMSNPIKTRLKTANLYKKYESNTMSSSEFLAMPADELNNWVSQAGVLSLIERGLVPRSIQDNMAPALKGVNEKNYLRSVKSRMFPVKLKTERGSIWEQPRRVYLPALKLIPDVPEKRIVCLYSTENLLEAENESSQRISLALNEESENALLEQEVHLINPAFATGWVIYIQNGKLIETTESFLSYYETITEMNLQPISSYIIDNILRISVSYSIPLITVKCYEVIDLCHHPFSTPIPLDRLMKCIFNKSEVQTFLSQKHRLYLNGDTGKSIAAGVIQYYYYRFKTRLQRKQNELNFRAKRRIRAFLGRFKAKKSFRRKFQERIDTSIKNFEILQANFLRAGGSIFVKNRVIIYICPSDKENETFNHIYRAYSLLLHPSVVIILVMHDPPYNLKEQIAQLIDVTKFGDPIVKKRLHIVVPEVSPQLPKNSSTGASLLFSVVAIAKVKELCKGKYPLIIADTMTQYVANLCTEIHCPFYGPSLKLSQDISKTSLEIYGWLDQFGLPMMPAYDMKRSYNDIEISQKAEEIKKSATDIKKWKFTRYDRFGRKHIGVENLDNLETKFSGNNPADKEKHRSFWIFGGLLEAAPNFERYKLIQIGAQLDVNGEWKVLAVTESNIVNHKETGFIIPQQTMSADELTDLMVKITACLKKHSFIGYFTVVLYYWENPDSNSHEYKISSIVTSLNRAILQSLAFTAKTRLVLDPAKYSLSVVNNETPFVPPHLTPNSNPADWNEHFKQKLPSSDQRIIFATDTIEHDLFNHIKTSVCAISLQRRDVNFDNWAMIGIEFPPSQKKLPVICVDQTIEKVYESFLGLLIKIEELALESEYPFNDNLHWNAYNALYYLMRERKKSGNDKKIFPIEFEVLRKKLSIILNPYLSDKLEIKEESKREDLEAETEKSGMTAETLLLISQEIPSIAAYKKDPSLLKPTLVSKHPKKKGLDSKRAEERAAALLKILEISDFSNDKPWTKLL